MKKLKTKTESEVVEEASEVISELAPHYTFGYYDVDDIRQECFIFVIEALEKYDEAKPLKPFLRVHLTYRLLNLIRNKFRRSDSPCRLCHDAKDGVSGHPDGQFCKKYLLWKKRNADKSSLASPKDINEIDQGVTQYSENSLDKISSQELFDLIDMKLSPQLRADYLKMRSGVKISKGNCHKVCDAILKIFTQEEIIDYGTAKA